MGDEVRIPRSLRGGWATSSSWPCLATLVFNRTVDPSIIGTVLTVTTHVVLKASLVLAGGHWGAGVSGPVCLLRSRDSMRKRGKTFLATGQNTRARRQFT